MRRASRTAGAAVAVAVAVAGTMLALDLVAGPAPGAGAAAAPAFLDGRPIVIDLDVAELDDAWSVPVVVPTGVTSIGLDNTMSPPVLALRRAGADPTGPLEAGVAEFEMLLVRAEASVGELVLHGPEGVAARRAVRVAHGAGLLGVPGRLAAQGVRTHPFGGDVRVRSVDLPDEDVSTSRLVGRLVSADDDAEVVQTPDGLSFAGVDGAGTYKGKIDILPGAKGGEVEVQLDVRDQLVWPLVVLVTGLALVTALDIGRRRNRDARVFAIELRRLVEEAGRDQGRPGVTVRVTGGKRDPLLLDQLVKEALDGYGGALDEERRKADGAVMLKELKALADRVQALGDSQQVLGARRDDIVELLPPERRAAAASALARSPVGQALAAATVRRQLELERVEDAVEAALAYADRFSSTAARLKLASAPGGPDAARAGELLDQLLADPDHLAEVSEAAHVLRLAPPPPAEVAAGDATDEAQVAVLPGTTGAAPRWRPGRENGAKIGARERRQSRFVPLAVAAGAFVLVAVMAGGQAQYDAQGPGPGASGGGGSSTSLPATGPEPLAPTEADLAPPGTPDEPARPADFVAAGLLATLLAGGAALVVWLVTRRRATSPAEGRTAVELERELRRSDRRLSAVSGLLVVLSGLVALYVPNASFGSAGDYLGALLWGTSLTTGVELARRFAGQAGAS